MRTAKQLLITVAVLLCSTVVSAHDFEVGGIYYNILSSSDLTVEVTHKGSSWGLYYEYSGKLVIPETVTYKSKTYRVTTIGNYAFYKCTGLTSVTIPNSVTTIGYNAFEGCTGLTSVTIPNSVTTIGGCAFSDCRGLTSVTIGNRVTTIEYEAFSGCNGLKEVRISDLAAWCKIDFEGDTSNPLHYANNLYLNGELVTELAIPNGVTEIKNYAFYNCTGLTSVTIPNSVTTIGERAFYGCTGLTSITIGNSVTTIGIQAFYDCTGLTSIEIPNSVTTIGDYAFYNCTGLTSITIPNSVTTIGIQAFYDCTGLTSIEIPNSVTTIGIYAFYNTAWYNNQPDGLIYAGKVLYSYKGTMPQNTPIAIKDGTLGIAEYAFEDCTGLISITIPSSVTTIGIQAFRGCTNLKEIYSLSETPPVIHSIYTFSDYSATLYVPIGAKETYQTTDYWKEFANIVEMDFTGITEISPDATDGFGNGAIYDLNGRPVNEPAKGGIYMVVKRWCCR